MTTARASVSWRVRRAGSTGPGRRISFAQLTETISDGIWRRADEVRCPGEKAWVPIGDHELLETHLPAGRRLRPKPEEEAEMDITPMIDVTFQLIIFFMITATFVVQKTLDMPQGEETSEESTASQPTWSDIQERYIMVELTSDQRITVDGAPTTLAELPGVLDAATRDRGLVEMALKVDDDVVHNLVVAVLDAAAGAEIEMVHFTRGQGSGGEVLPAVLPGSG